VLFTTHDIRTALVAADRILVLGNRDGGKGRGSRIERTYDLEALGIARAAHHDAVVTRALLEDEIEGYFIALWQSHRQFRLFAATLTVDGMLGPLATEVASFRALGPDRADSAGRRAASTDVGNIICHDLYVTPGGEFFVVFLAIA